VSAGVRRSMTPLSRRLAVSLSDDLAHTLDGVHAAHPYLRRHSILRLALRVGLADLARASADEIRDRAAAEIALSRAASAE